MADLLSILGGIAGGAAGTAIAPGVGTAIGSALGSELGGTISEAGIPAALGAGQLAAGALKKKKAEGLAPPMEDVEQRILLSELEQQRKSMLTGTAYQEQMRELGTMQAATQAGMIKAGGGAGGATLEGLSKASAATAEGFGKIAGEGEKMAFGYTQMVNELLGNMAQRRADLQLYKYTSSLADAAKLQQGGMQNILGAAATGSVPSSDGALDSETIAKLLGSLATG